jgi:hypothetical protein
MMIYYNNNYYKKMRMSDEQEVRYSRTKGTECTNAHKIEQQKLGIMMHDRSD